MESATMSQLELFDSAAFKFRKAEPPALGPAFNQEPALGGVLWEGLPGSMALMFDTDKLTLGDYNNMRTHPQIHASLSLITFMIHQSDWSIKCEEKKIQSAVEENMALIWTPLVRAISTAYWAGYSPNALEWDNESSGRYIFIDKVKDLDPVECAVHWKEVPSSYTPRPEDLQGSHTNFIIPKVKVYDGIKKFGLQFPIAPDNTFWYPCLMERGNYYGRKLLKAAFMPWYFSILIHLYSNRYFERFGEPVPIGRAPLDQDYEYKDSDGSVKKITAKQAMEQILIMLRSGGRVVLPSDRDESASNTRSEYTWDVEYLESQMRGADFERYLSRLDEEISLAIFTPLLLMRSGERGSLNLGVQHTMTWLWSLNALMADLKAYIDAYICQRIKKFNFSERAPRVEWVPRKMGKDNVETIRAMVSALISGNLAQPDLEELGVALGMTLEEVKQVAPQPGTIVDTRNRTERTDRTVDGPRIVGKTPPTTTTP
jgi:hypothetical protein